MATLTIRNLEPALKERLRVRASEHGHSMEDEARRILRNTLEAPSFTPEIKLNDRIRARVDPPGGVTLDLQRREPAREPPTFE